MMLRDGVQSWLVWAAAVALFGWGLGACDQSTTVGQTQTDVGVGGLDGAGTQDGAGLTLDGGSPAADAADVMEDGGTPGDLPTIEDVAPPEDTATDTVPPEDTVEDLPPVEDATTDTMPGDTTPGDTATGEDGTVMDSGSAGDGGPDTDTDTDAETDAPADTSDCLITVDCGDGMVAGDSDGDGCDDTCLPAPCGANADCGEGSYCERPGCGTQGTCQPRPVACPEVLAPVCGCDDQTYDNECLAASAGVSVASEGSCGGVCGGIANLPCAPSETCDIQGCGIMDPMGVCVPTPTVCPDAWMPVCGCDGQTYSTDCDRLVAGVAKDHDGQCACEVIIVCKSGETPVDTDGDGCDDTCEPTACLDNTDCPKSFFCATDGGANPGAVDACAGPGVCALRPLVCLANLDPVCGCDGATYGNACEAHQAGVNVASKGACEQTCGGLLGDTCQAAGQWCDLAEGACFSKSAPGVCVDIPLFCGDVVAPVCGCDGTTYTNDCLRQQAQVQKDHDGACEPCMPIDCWPGTTPADTDGDGCMDTCLPNGCVTDKDCAVIVPLDGGEATPQAPLPAGEMFCQLNACGTPGQCATKPVFCDKLYAPVCSCDGVTYDNSCFAAMAGASVAYKGVCDDQSCSGPGDPACSKSEWCEPGPGVCGWSDGGGTCSPVVLDLCPDTWAPVCGCDGVTYANDCERQQAQVGLASTGACDCLIVIDCLPGYEPVDTDGDGCADTCQPTVCSDNAQCPQAPPNYCKTKTCGGEGTCEPVPTVCPLAYIPVCGCDGQTYGNSCLAAVAGVSVDYDGACVDQQCGGLTGGLCPAGQTCDYDAGMCGVMDPSGVCVDVPELCPKVLAPVCGCDGVTYDNDCFRLQAGAAKDHDGTCECGTILTCPAGYEAVDTNGDGCADTCQPIPCLGNGECAPWDYCSAPVCGGSGTCQARPSVCADLIAPVCGCDMKTYDNGCFAAQAGVNVAYKGACKLIVPME